ncbi:hypothetical protein WJX84_000969, partial [Apatococcus fuscideae]
MSFRLRLQNLVKDYPSILQEPCIQQLGTQASAEALAHAKFLAAATATLIELAAFAQHLKRPVLCFMQNLEPSLPSLLEKCLRQNSEQQSAGSLDAHAAVCLRLAHGIFLALQQFPALRAYLHRRPLYLMLQHQVQDVRWCGIQCLGLAAGLADAALQKLQGQLLTPCQAAACHLSYLQHTQQVQQERAKLWQPAIGPRASAPAAAERPEQRSPKRMRLSPEAPDARPASSSSLDLCGVVLTKRSNPADEPMTDATIKSQLCWTGSMRSALQSSAAVLGLDRPLLIFGPPGCGKTCLVKELAQKTGNSSSMLHVHVDDQMDSKSLLGAYICTSVPGQFSWQPGPLAKAVCEGRWLVIENIDLAPPDVLASLRPLLEGRALHLPNRAAAIDPAPGFQLIGTVTQSPSGGLAARGLEEMAGGLWLLAAMHSPSPVEQQQILQALYPDLGPILPQGLAMLRLCQLASGQTLPPTDPASNPSEAEDIAQGIFVSDTFQHARPALRSSRQLSLRDLCKWCQRMQDIHHALLLRSLRGGSEASGVCSLPLNLREAAFEEAHDCFAAHCSQHEGQTAFLRAFALIWALPEDHVEQHLVMRRPALQHLPMHLTIGRASLPLLQPSGAPSVTLLSGSASRQGPRFAQTGHAMRTLECVAAAVQQAEPLLLVGETGTGKTAVLQSLAQQTGAKLVVLNLSQQTDSADLLGGFMPLDPQEALLPLLPEFQDLVVRTWPGGKNDAFLSRTLKFAQRRKWHMLFSAFRGALQKVLPGSPADTESPLGHSGRPESPSTRKTKRTAVLKSFPAAIRQAWSRFAVTLDGAEQSFTVAMGGLAFAFREGALVKAVREGHWLLLDEINLAPPEALERIAGLLEDKAAGLTVSERGDANAMQRSPHFRLLAAMNPATDAGKRALPTLLRSRFTELWVSEPSAKEDLEALVASYLKDSGCQQPVGSVANFYLAAKADAAAGTLQDGAGSKPSYNLRTLCRALEYTRFAVPMYGSQRALYDGCVMAFQTQLHPNTVPHLDRLLQHHLLPPGTSMKGLMRSPAKPRTGEHVLFDHFWIEQGPLPPTATQVPGGRGPTFVITPTMNIHLQKLARAMLLRKYPILLQGPTSSGKTSLVGYLAAQTGHCLIRINNHEGTDLQEYLGSSVPDAQGRLAFQEGPLVKALREGHWVVLDELNLAPSDVLEALNRLLDDNRELFVPELQETIKPHSHFMLFATQNPPGLYGGRKVLSRAFRSRFLELHVDDIPHHELSTILEQRCAIAPSYARKLVDVMQELQRRRQVSNMFAGKRGFITARDLFKWAERQPAGPQAFAEEGYLLLGERLRTHAEQADVQQALEATWRVKLDMPDLYQREGQQPFEALQTQLGQGTDLAPEEAAIQKSMSGIVWTPSMRRMYTLLDRCWKHLEPALLIGETGTGKTTVCQLVAHMRGQPLVIVNCNQHTEASDFLGSYRPTRDRQLAVLAFQEAFMAAKANRLMTNWRGVRLQYPAKSAGSELMATAKQAAQMLTALSDTLMLPADAEALKELQSAVAAMQAAAAAVQAPFAWVDGPLILAMKLGHAVLLDEINLAEDAVLERLN